VISLVEDNPTLFEEELDSSGPPSLRKAGSFGLGNALSPPNIRTTEAMLGRSSGCCCTHKRLMCMHLSTSEGLHDSSLSASINSDALPSFHNLHV